ncbi:hypothetical protein [Lentzea fradiae]|uniref:hypothetical protein n=1 Tax=Lentzea fradiae TaxID=200378 RepID=UPI000B7E0C59|nr:hypothetical protein [Lentzea fradiae]
MNRYHYFAITTDTFPLVEDPRIVVRRWLDESGKPHDEAFTGNLVWVDSGSTLDGPDAVIRTWKGPRGGDLDEWYVAGSGWTRTSIRELLARGRKDGTLEPVDQATAERLVQLEEQRHAGRR